MRLTRSLQTTYSTWSYGWQVVSFRMRVQGMASVRPSLHRDVRFVKVAVEGRGVQLAPLLVQNLSYLHHHSSKTFSKLSISIPSPCDISTFTTELKIQTPQSLTNTLIGDLNTPTFPLKRVHIVVKSNFTLESASKSDHAASMPSLIFTL